MNTPRALWLLVVLALPACTAKPVLTSTLPASPAPDSRFSVVGAQVPALLPGTTGAVAAQQKSELERRLKDAKAPVRIMSLPEDALGLRIAAADSFETGSAQLKLAALTGYAEIAEVMKAFPGSVAHVLVYGDPGDSPEPGDMAFGLRARRAASILDYLARRGIPMTRLRSEIRSAAAVGEQVELVLKPVVQGREAMAWTPPPFFPSPL